jgi:subtilisin family serine protease
LKEVLDLKTAKLITSLLFILGLFILPLHSVSAEDKVKIVIKYKEKQVHALSTNSEPNLDIEVVSVPKDKVEQTIINTEKEKSVEYAEVDQPVFAQASTPNDPLYSNQLQVFNAIKASDAWEKYESQKEIVVAIVDSGIDFNHPDFKGNIIKGKNFVNDKLPPMDINGHGTHVAGLVAATTNNRIGISSLAGNVKIMPIKVFEERTGYMSTVIQGIKYAVDNGADIINLSLGSYNNMQALSDAIDYAISKDVLVVGAAGNDNEEAFVYPAAYSNVLGVASVDTNNLRKAAFSNFGEAIDVSAPGTSIFSTWINGYQSMEGTSMSTGIVSSLGAMIRGNSPFLTGLQTKEVIESSAEPLTSDYNLGNGLINANKALEYIQSKNRLAGNTSVGTAVAISKQGWEKLSEKKVSINNKDISGSFVVIANGDTFPDSLAASPLASYLDSPILLIKNQKLSSVVKRELERLNPSHALIIGGEEAVAKSVESRIDALDIKPVRIAGETRYDTAIAINKVIPYSSKKAFVVSGENYPDALSVASYSGSMQYPILFVKRDKIPSGVTEYIKKKQFTEVYIAGGNEAISDEVKSSLPDSYRLSGKDRYETNYQVHKFLGDMSIPDKLLFATGEKFPDALTGGALASKTFSPVILVDKKKNGMVKQTINLFPSKKDYYILGGPDVISVEKAWSLDRYVITK